MVDIDHLTSARARSLVDDSTHPIGATSSLKLLLSWCPCRILRIEIAHQIMQLKRLCYLQCLLKEGD